MGVADITMTPTEASKLFEEKIETLREKRTQAELATRSAVEELDKAQHEIGVLQQQKTDLINDIAQLTQDTQRLVETMAEHRANVEASLTKQEAQAAQTIEAAQEAQRLALEQQARALQLKAQVTGLKQTLKTELLTWQQQVETFVTTTNRALDAIPE